MTDFIYGIDGIDLVNRNNQFGVGFNGIQNLKKTVVFTFQNIVFHNTIKFDYLLSHRVSRSFIGMYRDGIFISNVNDDARFYIVGGISPIKRLSNGF